MAAAGASKNGAWVCDPCAERNGLNPNGGGSFWGGGWCGFGKHRVREGERIVWHARVPEIAAETAGDVVPAVAGQAEQLALF